MKIYKISALQDLEERDLYLQAVHSGDLATVEKMVEDAANKAGYTIKAWHGTVSKPFNFFDSSKSEKNTIH